MLPTNLLKPYKGFNDIRYYWGMFHRTYHSLQTSFDRRFRGGISFGVNWTLGLSDQGNTRPVGPVLRLDHAADASFSIRPDQADAEKLFGDQGLTRHIVTSNFVWDLPDLHQNNMVTRAIGAVINDWQLSGIFKWDSGSPYDVTYSYQNGGGTNLTGSPNYTARIVIPNLSAIGGGCSSNQYTQFNNAMVAGGANASFPLTSNVFLGPQVGSTGLESGRNLLHNCDNRTLDLAIARNIRLGGGRTVQLRADVFNAPNAVIFTNSQRTIQFNSPTDLTVRNSQFLADGSVDQTKLKPNQAGFGAATTAAAARNIQGQIKFLF